MAQAPSARPEDEQLRHYTLDRVAELLSVSERTARRYVHENGLPARRIRGRLFVPHQALVAWLAAHEEL